MVYQTHRLKEGIYRYWGGDGGVLGEGIGRGFGMNMCTLPYFKWITSKDLLCSTGNSAHYSATT